MEPAFKECLPREEVTCTNENRMCQTTWKELNLTHIRLQTKQKSKGEGTFIMDDNIDNLGEILRLGDCSRKAE